MEKLTASGLRIRTNDSEYGLRPVGWVLDVHKHFFPHTALVIVGAFKCWRWDGEDDPAKRKLLSHTVARRGDCLDVLADEYHRFECIEPGIIYCIFASRDPVTHEVVDHQNGFWPASGLQEPGAPKGYIPKVRA